MLDWDKLRIFHTAAEAGSFTHAAEKLNMSQSAVSRQISALEEDLGLKLFIRHARGKRPEFYDTPGLDQAMSMIMVLANEISVIHDRLDSSERVAKAHGLDLARSGHRFMPVCRQLKTVSECDFLCRRCAISSAFQRAS